MKFNSNVERNMFSIFVDKMKLVYDQFVQELAIYVKEQRILGRSDNEIITELEESQKSGTGIFKDLVGQIEAIHDDSLFTHFQITSNNFPNEKTKLFVRQLDPAAEHCDSCIYEANLPPRPLSKVVIPGMQQLHGKKNCERYCKCSIVEASKVSK